MVFDKRDLENQFREFAGWDVDWYGIDLDDHVGYFTSAGRAPIPTTVTAIRSDLAKVHALMRSLPATSDVEVGTYLNGTGVPPAMNQGYAEYQLEILEMARRGLFCYDAEPDEGSDYIRLVKPLRPLRSEELPEFVRNSISGVRLTCHFSQQEILKQSSN